MHRHVSQHMATFTMHTSYTVMEIYDIHPYTIAYIQRNLSDNVCYCRWIILCISCSCVVYYNNAFNGHMHISMIRTLHCCSKNAVITCSLVTCLRYNLASYVDSRFRIFFLISGGCKTYMFQTTLLVTQLYSMFNFRILLLYAKPLRLIGLFYKETRMGEKLSFSRSVCVSSVIVFNSRICLWWL